MCTVLDTCISSNSSESVNVTIDFVIDMIACITQSPSNERERERKDRKRTSLVRQPEFTLLFYQHLMIIKIFLNMSFDL